MKNLQNLLILILVLVVGDVIAQPNAAAKIKQVETGLFAPIQIEGEAPWTITERMIYYKVPGLSIAVIQNYRVIWAKGYGFANDSAKTPVTTQTLFQAGSISKSLNAVGVLKLVQGKKLDLYSDINNYLTSWKFPYDSLSKGKKITLANLLSHSAGLNLHGFGGYLQGQPLPTLVQVLNGEKPANTPLIRSMYEPGLKFEYSGGGTMISQLIVTDVTHTDYATYMKKEVLTPLGMTGSTFSQPPNDANASLLATAYNLYGNPIPGKFHIYTEQAAAGLWTNPTDLAKFIIEMQKAYAGKSVKVLNHASVKTMFTPYVSKDVALGVFVTRDDSTLYFSHDGVDAGFCAKYFGSMEAGNGVAVMVNSARGDILTEVVNSVAKVYGFNGLYKTNVKKIVTVPVEMLQTYIGEFELAPKRGLTIFMEDGRLFVRVSGDIKKQLYAQSATRFFLKELPYELEFLPDTTGKANLTLYGDGGKHMLKRLK